VNQWRAAGAHFKYFTYWCSAVSWITGYNYLLCLNHISCFSISFSASAFKCVWSHGQSPSKAFSSLRECLQQDKYNHWLIWFRILSENKAVVIVTMGQQDEVSTVHPAWGWPHLADFRMKLCCLYFTKLFYLNDLVRQFCNIIPWGRKEDLCIGRLTTTFVFPNTLKLEFRGTLFSVLTPLWVFHLHYPLPSTFLFPSWLILSFTVTLKRDFLICVHD